MNPSPEEISAGQKAYQGLLGYERFRASQKSKLSMFFNVVMVIALLNQILVWIHDRSFWMVTWGAVVLISLFLGLRIMEKTKRKNFELLRQLKAKYGPEIYEEIKKEPDSLQYKFFQKSYRFKPKPIFVELP